MRKILFLFLLLLASTVAPQTVSRTYTESPRLDSLQAAVYSRLNIKAGGSRRITDVLVTHAINRAIIATCIDFPALELIDTVLIGKSDTLGTLPAKFHRLRKAWRCRGDTLLIPVMIINPDSVQSYKKVLADYRHNKTKPSSPDLCWTHGIKLLTYPEFVGKTSTSIDTMRISYFGIDAGLSADADTTIVAPSYIKHIVDFACGDVSMSRRRFNEASAFFQMYGGRSAVDRIQELKK